MITKGGLIALLQDSAAPDSAIVDVTIGNGDLHGDVKLSSEEPYWLHIADGPNAGDWLTLELDE